MFFFHPLWQGFSVQHWLSWNSVCRPDWPPTHKSACLCLPSAGIKGVCHYEPATLVAFIPINNHRVVGSPLKHLLCIVWIILVLNHNRYLIILCSVMILCESVCVCFCVCLCLWQCVCVFLFVYALFSWPVSLSVCWEAIQWHLSCAVILYITSLSIGLSIKVTFPVLFCPVVFASPVHYQVAPPLSFISTNW